MMLFSVMFWLRIQIGSSSFFLINTKTKTINMITYNNHLYPHPNHILYYDDKYNLKLDSSIQSEVTEVDFDTTNITPDLSHHQYIFVQSYLMLFVNSLANFAIYFKFLTEYPVALGKESLIFAARLSINLFPHDLCSLITRPIL